MELLERLRAAGEAAGLAGFGVCAADPWPEVRASLDDRVATGRSAGMSFTFRDPAAATDVKASFPWAERLVVGAWSYGAAGGPGEPATGTGRIARFAAEDHYRDLRAALAAIGALLTWAGHRAEVLIDDSRLVDRAAAVRAGVGWWGKNSMVLAPAVGPWLLLGSVVTDAALAVSVPMARDCGTCSACLPACPTGALVAPGILDARRCLAHIAQAPGVIPDEFREAMGDRVYGCDDCLEACPPGHRATKGAAHLTAGRVGLLELLGADDATLLRRFGHFYIPRRAPRFLRRNALVALGNAGGPAAVQVAAGYLGHPDWLLRLHAAWSLGTLGGTAARAALTAAARRERHGDVAAAIAAARSRIGTLTP